MIGTDYEERDGTCWYKTTTLKRLYPEYDNFSNDDFSAKLYAEIGQPLTMFHPWKKLLTSVAVAFIFSPGILALGWECSGPLQVSNLRAGFSNSTYGMHPPDEAFTNKPRRTYLFLLGAAPCHSY